MLTPSEFCGSLQSEPMGIRGLEHTPLTGSESRFGEGASQNAAQLQSNEVKSGMCNTAPIVHYALTWLANPFQSIEIGSSE